MKKKRVKRTEAKMKWRLFDKAVGQVRDAFLDLSADQLSKIIDEAVASTRRKVPRPRVS
jgi:hypothetical protein